jgi:hypothetical protein
MLSLIAAAALAAEPWVLDHGANLTGTLVYYTASRSAKDDDRFATFNYICYAASKPEIFVRVSVIQLTNPYLDVPAQHDAADGTTNLNVFAVSGVKITRLKSWAIRAEQGVLGLMKITPGLTPPDDVGGVYYLTAQDLLALVSADFLQVSINGTESYVIPMEGFRAASASVLAKCAGN